MTTTFDITKYEGQIANIMAKVPANPYIVDLVGRAIQILSENSGEEYFSNRLSTVATVAEYIGKVSNPTFYKHHVLLASILAGVDEDKYEKLDTPTKTITNAVVALTKVVLAEESCKDRWNAVYAAGTIDPDLLATTLIMLTDEVNREVAEDAYSPNTLLMVNGYVEANLRKTSLTITNEMYPYYNAFLAAVNKAQF